MLAAQAPKSSAMQAPGLASAGSQPLPQSEAHTADVLKVPLEKYASLVAVVQQTASQPAGSAVLGLHHAAANLLQIAELKEVCNVWRLPCMLLMPETVVISSCGSTLTRSQLAGKLQIQSTSSVF